jgi:hypothetical protein
MYLATPCFLRAWIHLGIETFEQIVDQSGARFYRKRKSVLEKISDFLWHVSTVALVWETDSPVYFSRKNWPTNMASMPDE